MVERMDSGSAARGWGASVARIPGVAVMLAVMIAVFALMSPGFTRIENLSNVMLQSVVLLLIALPMTLIIMTEGIDLSMGAMLTVVTIVYALVLLATQSFVIALLAVLAAGVSLGLANGVLVARVGMPPFVVTLGTMGVWQGLSLILSNGQSVVGLPREAQFAYSGSVLGVPVPLILAAVCYASIHWMLYHSRFGVCVVALGGNREALRQAGVNDKLVLASVYALGGLVVGLAAPVFCARINAAHPTAGIGMEFDAIAAVAVGGTQFERGNGWLLGTLLGVIAIGVLRNGLNLLAVPSSVQVACIGLLVILALFVDTLRGRSA